MNAAQVEETSVNANNNSPSRDRPRASDHTRQITILKYTSLKKENARHSNLRQNWIAKPGQSSSLQSSSVKIADFSGHKVHVT